MQLSISDPAKAAEPAALWIAPLGVPLRIGLPAFGDIGQLARACRRWRGAPGASAAHHTITIESAPELTGRGATRITVSGALMEICGPGVRAWADTRRQSAACYLSRDYLADPDALADDVLEPLILRLLTRADRTPLHASGIVLDGLAILLAGPSGSGKSCLARAADAAGLQVLSDDVVYVQTAPRLRVWGWPAATHLLPGDAPAADLPTRVRNGKTKFVVPLRSASSDAIACDRAVLCVLAHGATPALTPISTSQAVKRLWPLDPGFDQLPRAIRFAVRTLSARGAWELRLSDDPDAAIALLRSSIGQLRHSAAG